MKLHIKHFFILLFFFCYITLPTPALAAAPISPTPTPNTLPLQMLQVDPIISDLHLIPGQDTAVVMTIKNLADKPLGIHAQLSHFTDPQTDAPISTSLDSMDMVAWTSIENPDIIMDAHETKKISIVIHTPSNAKNSGYAEMVFLTPFVSNNMQQGSPIVLSRIGALILGTAGKLNYDNLIQKTFISSFEPQQTIMDHGPITFHFTVQNTYFTYFTAKPFLAITSLFGQSQTTLLAEHHILPGSAHTWNGTIPATTLGIYLAHLAVSIGEGKQITADSYVIIFPRVIVFGIIVMIALLIVILFIKTKKTRIKKALRILIKGR